MKHTLSLLVIICCFASTAAAQQEPEYQRVIEVEASSQDIYSAIRQYLAETMRSSQHVIQVDDPEAGIVTGNFILNMPVGNRLKRNLDTRLTATFEARDGRFRYTARGFLLYLPGITDADYHELSEKIVAKIPDELDVYTEEVAAYISGWRKSASDDW